MCRYGDKFRIIITLTKAQSHIHSVRTQPQIEYNYYIGDNTSLQVFNAEIMLI